MVKDWDPEWRLVPPRRNDFNVPTPVPVGDKLLVSTENNGTSTVTDRLYDTAGNLASQSLPFQR